MILFRLLMERQQRPGAADWSAFWFGSLAGIVPCALIAVYVAQPARVPGFVYAITIVQFVLFFSFAVNMVFQYAQIGRWRDHVHGEVVYIILSFTAKSLLARLIFANVLRTLGRGDASLHSAICRWPGCACVPADMHDQVPGHRGTGVSSR